ncbi:MAG: hypothetical protein LBS60_03770 [Deltaproteobacteria bacterium]|jgi:hypothetical protein|nr:hypothetical protein [Deltaproteobacteria bacterium]
MKITNTLDDELDKISVEIYEETKNLSRKEFLEYFRKHGEEAAKKYGFTIAKPLNSKGDDQDQVK